MYAFFDGSQYLNNDFQDPHFGDITAYIEAVYAGDTEAFRAVHGDPDAWQKVEVDPDLASTVDNTSLHPYIYIALTISGGESGHQYPYAPANASEGAGLTFTVTLQTEEGYPLHSVLPEALLPDLTRNWGIAIYRVGADTAERVKNIALVEGVGTIDDFSLPVSGDFEIRAASFTTVTVGETTYQLQFADGSDAKQFTFYE